jgi:hypothetical protein
VTLPLPRSWLILAPLLATACGAWPVYNHLPSDGDPLPSSTDPRTLVEAGWVAVDPVDAEQPPGGNRGELVLGQGLVAEGQLEGIGWSDSVDARLLNDPRCGTQGTRAPDPRGGDWVGDVDVLSALVAAPGWLCVEARTDAPDIGLDLIAWQLDECGIPERTLHADDGRPFGWNLRGPNALWRANVAKGDRLAIVLAGFAPNDGSRLVNYTLALSMVEDGPCPLPPAPAEAP